MENTTEKRHWWCFVYLIKSFKYKFLFRKEDTAFANVIANAEEKKITPTLLKNYENIIANLYMKDTKANVHYVALLNISYLGYMTKDEVKQDNEFKSYEDGLESRTSVEI